MKPRVRFCWMCSRKLRGNHHIEAEVDGHMRIMHKTCNQARVEGKKSISMLISESIDNHTLR